MPDNSVERRFRVFYQRRNGSYAFIKDVVYNNPVISPYTTEELLEKVFHDMQGEIWSPNGEARNFIISSGLSHTSMMVGDVVRDMDMELSWKVESMGWSVFTGCS